MINEILTFPLLALFTVMIALFVPPITIAINHKCDYTGDKIDYLCFGYGLFVLPFVLASISMRDGQVRMMSNAITLGVSALYWFLMARKMRRQNAE